jgi:hypothetical protein
MLGSVPIKISFSQSIFKQVFRFFFLVSCTSKLSFGYVLFQKCINIMIFICNIVNRQMLGILLPHVSIPIFSLSVAPTGYFMKRVNRITLFYSPFYL